MEIWSAINLPIIEEKEAVSKMDPTQQIKSVLKLLSGIRGSFADAQDDRALRCHLFPPIPKNYGVIPKLRPRAKRRG